MGNRRGKGEQLRGWEGSPPPPFQIPGSVTGAQLPDPNDIFVTDEARHFKFGAHINIDEH